ncbi:MAG: ThiF family adenylyltransferase [Nitrososphaerota archaeon]
MQGGDAHSSDRMERYDRQLRLDGWNQSLLQEARVAVAGVGALGCEVSKNLALMGVGELLLIDSDYVELSNLSRQMLFTDSDIGRPKSITAKQRLEIMNPDVSITALQADVRRLPLSTFEDADILLACVDNWPSRRWLNSLAVELSMPLVDVSMDGFYANVQDVIPGKTPCIECHGDTLIPVEIQTAECSLRRRRPEDLVNELKERGETLEIGMAEMLFQAGIKTIYDIKYTPLSRLVALPRSLQETVGRLREALNPKMPALQSVSATISGIAALEAVKILHNGSLGKPYGGLIIYDGLAGRVSRVPLKRNDNCFVCGSETMMARLELDVRRHENILDVKKRIAAKFLYPDVDLQLGSKLLEDDQLVADIPLRDGETLYVHTSRRVSPLELRVRVVEDSG